MVPFKNILVPVNGTESDREALSLACRVAKQTKGRVQAIHVIEVKRTLPLDAEMDSEVQFGEDVLDRAERLGEEFDCPVETELLQAREVGPTVVDEARERGADLVIIGLNYKKRFGEFNLGKTTPYVLKHAHCRVWICRGEQNLSVEHRPATAAGTGARR